MNQTLETLLAHTLRAMDNASNNRDFLVQSEEAKYRATIVEGLRALADGIEREGRVPRVVSGSLNGTGQGFRVIRD